MPLNPPSPAATDAAPQVARPGDPLAALSAAFPASVTITRTAADDCQTRQLIVSIDGREVATLLYGDSIRCDLTPGPHTLRVYNTLVWKTVDFLIRPGEQVFFEAVNRASTSTYLVVAILGVGPLYVRIRRM
jgi:hypothetical protein